MNDPIARRVRVFAVAALASAAATLPACASLEAYSRRVARDACRSAGTCTVYAENGAHEVPCWPTHDGPMAYPGDAQWPFERGVCDTVEQMNGEQPLPGTATASVHQPS
ncbi:MAG TPA: hypothetical protein VFD92_04195 [Candidatus Binatia bacterium]|nr:hypothetical protein [Candidatus Binatia bacterium]